MWYFLDAINLKYFNTLHIVNKTENHGEGQVLTIFMEVCVTVHHNHKVHEYPT
jgi:hypothetical protein